MLQQIKFYFWHSLNDLEVNGRRTFFALLCIAAGVAAIVSLETVAGMIGDTLTGNLQATNRGDIQISLQGGGFGGNNDDPALKAGATSGFLEAVQVSVPFSTQTVTTYQMGQSTIQQLQKWIDQNYPGQIDMTYKLQAANVLDIFTSSGVGTNVTDTTLGTAASSISPILIEPQKYPFYAQIKSLDGQPLSALIQAPTDIVIDKKLADTLTAKVGDTIQLSGSTSTFNVRAIVPTDAEVTDPFSGIFAALFGFYYLDNQAAPLFTNLKQPAVDKVYFKLQDPTRVSEVNNVLMKQYPFLKTTTIDALRVQNKQISDQVNQLVTVIGLISLLLGSIGIINTMQVIVRRRTVEVAVLKTLGLQGGQVTILFLVEAFIMGVIGSLAGILLGWVTTFVIKGVAESVVAQTLTFRVVPQAVVNGIIVGTLVTTIFGFLPTLAAGQVRPGIVLRPNDDIIPRSGCLQTFLALIAIVVALSFVTQSILGSFGTALAVTIGAFIGAGILYGLLSVLIWLVGHFLPSFGLIDLKLSLRQMLASRSRAAVTLLALVIGVFSLSLITLFATSINNLLSSALGVGAGGNVIVTSATPIGLQNVENVLTRLDGVKSYQVIRTFDGQLVSLQQADGTVLTTEQLKARIRQNVGSGFLGAAVSNSSDAPDFGDIYLQSFNNVDGRELNQLPDRQITSGRQLNAADAGQPVMVIEDNQGVEAAGIKVGDKLTYLFGDGANAPSVTFEIVGLSAASLTGSSIAGNPAYAPIDAFPKSVQPNSTLILADIAEQQIPALRRAVGTIPGTFVLETSVFTKLISSLLGTFTAFPTMVALLGLIVGGVVIANSVALATLERRREIAVMKAVGLQRERVLGMLLLENGVLGLIGGLIGVGIGVLALYLLLSLSNSSIALIPYGTALILMGLCIAVALIAAMTTAWGASGEKPLNVLRYE